MKYIKMRAITVLAVILAIAACTKDLDTVPLDKDVITSASVYEDFDSYKMVLAKLYAGLSLSGQTGPHGNNDLSGLDEGFGQYLRGYWYAQELPTDECIIAWNDLTLKDYHEQDWTSSDPFIANLYYRLFYQIALCNEFIRESADSKLDERGMNATQKEEIAEYRAEARFLRALSYGHALDLFGNVPFVTEEDKVGSFFPQQIMRADLFDYVESELLAIETELPVPMTNEYARADQAAAWMVLAKLYLNAEVYIGTPKYTETITYAKKVIDAGYTLDTEWENLFLADNHTADGIIFPIAFDGVHTKTWGGTTFIINSAVGGSMNPEDFGISGGWAGIRVTKELVGKFINLETLKKKGDLPGRKAYPVLYVPGSYQGWDPSDATTVVASVNDDGKYEGYLWFPDADAQFKFSNAPDWDHSIFGDVDASGTTGTLTKPGNNIVAGAAGYYKVNVDTVALTYTIEKTDWGLIGDATGSWDVDQDMTYDAVEGVWELIVELGTGSIKFRANNDWVINYGDAEPDGILDTESDNNIAISEAGKYEIKIKLGSPDYTYTIEQFSSDGRIMFYSDGQSLEIDDVFEFTEGWAVTKFKNITSTGAPGSDQTHPDTDFPMFRLADAYLMYAEAVLRGGTGGDAATALTYVNMLRERAYGDANGNITADDLDLDFILDERAREFLWEAHRRTDLVRFGRFSNTTYTWAWKGGSKEGQSVESFYDLYPIPASDVAANLNLEQNDGYY